jgi:hypothetical protein
MILFIGPEPTKNNLNDGLIQRVQAIDQNFSDKERRILSVSFTGNLHGNSFRRSNTLSVEHLNAFIHLLRIYRLARSSSCIYVHTCGQAFRVLFLYFIFSNIITDLHGIVPEEIALQKKRFARLRYELIERIVVRHSKALICVTEAMQRHYLHKYGKVNAEFFIIPIFPMMHTPKNMSREPNMVVYCGGVQAWQCIDEMLQAAAQTAAKMRFVLLTGNTIVMKEKAAAAGLSALILSAPKRKLVDYYAQASFGFVLRDDNIVNRVACPTKIVEYMYYGVIPIVKAVEIGDFAHANYCYVRIDDYLRGRIPCAAKLEEMRTKNRRVIDILRTNNINELLRLRAYLS